MEKPTKTPTLPKFDTIEQLMADKYLISRVQEKIDHINAERDRVSEGGTKKLKASPVEFLITVNKFTPEYITTEYLEIYHKRSKLNFSFREFITLTIQECVGETFKHYESLYQKQQRKTTKTKNHGKIEH